MYDVAPGDASVDVYCDTAFGFLHLLDPLQGLFQSSYLFRGVSSQQHGLLPSAHRPGVRLLTPDHKLVSGPLDTVRTQCGGEFYTLERFFSIAARHGVRLPEDSYVVRKHLDELAVLFQQNDESMYRDRFWPAAELYSLIALAQHYGVPTRALDWSYSSYVAAYFAARSALGASDGRIAVWAVDDFHRQVDRVLDVTSERPLHVFTVSGAENENLRAQRGLFMLHRQDLSEPFADFRPVEYNVLLRESLPVLRQAVQFIRVLVDASQAGEVLALLSSAGISRGSLYPGFVGVVGELEDERLIPAPSRTAAGHTLETIGLWDRIHDAARQGA